jgi:hypothetical protein
MIQAETQKTIRLILFRERCQGNDEVTYTSYIAVSLIHLLTSGALRHSTLIHNFWDWKGRPYSSCSSAIQRQTIVLADFYDRLFGDVYMTSYFWQLFRSGSIPKFWERLRQTAHNDVTVFSRVITMKWAGFVIMTLRQSNNTIIKATAWKFAKTSPRTSVKRTDCCITTTYHLIFSFSTTGCLPKQFYCRPTPTILCWSGY